MCSDFCCPLEGEPKDHPAIWLSNSKEFAGKSCKKSWVILISYLIVVGVSFTNTSSILSLCKNIQSNPIRWVALNEGVGVFFGIAESREYVADMIIPLPGLDGITHKLVNSRGGWFSGGVGGNFGGLIKHRLLAFCEFGDKGFLLGLFNYLV